MKAKRVSAWVLAEAMLPWLLPVAKVQAQGAVLPAGNVADPTETAATREQLLMLLRVSPTLTAVVASDPSLLGNQEYVAKTNPELATFLGQHPEVGRNPEFHLFADMHTRGPNRVPVLERRCAGYGMEARRVGPAPGYIFPGGVERLDRIFHGRRAVRFRLGGCHGGPGNGGEA